MYISMVSGRAPRARRRARRRAAVAFLIAAGTALVAAGCGTAPGHSDAARPIPCVTFTLPGKPVPTLRGHECGGPLPSTPSIWSADFTDISQEVLLIEPDADKPGCASLPPTPGTGKPPPLSDLTPADSVAGALGAVIDGDHDPALPARLPQGTVVVAPGAGFRATFTPCSGGFGVKQAAAATNAFHLLDTLVDDVVHKTQSAAQATSAVSDSTDKLIKCVGSALDKLQGIKPPITAKQWAYITLNAYGLADCSGALDAVQDHADDNEAPTTASEDDSIIMDVRTFSEEGLSALNEALKDSFTNYVQEY